MYQSFEYNGFLFATTMLDVKINEEKLYEKGNLLKSFVNLVKNNSN